jgi:hypothetical protein
MIAFKLLLIAFIAIFVQVQGNPEMIMKLVTSCKEKVGPTEDDVAHLMKLQKPNNQAQKCMLSCLFEGVKVVSNLKNLAKFMSFNQLIFR